MTKGKSDRRGKILNWTHVGTSNRFEHALRFTLFEAELHECKKCVAHDRGLLGVDCAAVNRTVCVLEAKTIRVRACD